MSTWQSKTVRVKSCFRVISDMLFHIGKIETFKVMTVLVGTSISCMLALTVMAGESGD